MTTCQELKESSDEHKEWIEKYRYHLEILRKDHELIVDKGFSIFFAVDFYDIFEYCFPYGHIIGKESDYKNEGRRSRLMELQFARSFLFYGTETKPIILLPPYAAEATAFFRSTYLTLRKYKDDILKREILKILFQDQKIKDVITEIEKEGKTPKRQEKLLRKISESSSEVFFLLSSGFLEGINVLNDLFKKHEENGKTYRVIDPNPGNIKHYRDILEKTGNMDNSEIEILFRTRRGKYIQNVTDAKALQYVLQLNKLMQEDKQAIFLFSNATYMKKEIKGQVLVNIEGEEYDTLRDLDTLYVYLIEIRDIDTQNKEDVQKEILKKIKKSLAEFNDFNKLSQDIPGLIRKCDFLKEDRPCSQKSEAQCPFFEEINEINKSLEKVEKLRSNIENINLMKQIDVILSPLFSKDEKTFLKLRFEDHKFPAYEKELLSIFNKIREFHEDSDMFFDELEELENQLEFERLKELFSISSDSLSVQEPFMYRSDPLFLVKMPFRIEIREEKFKKIFSDIRAKAAACRDELLEKNVISEDNRKKLDGSLRELARLSRKIEGEVKYIIWQIIFLCNKRYDLVRIWNEHYRDQMKDKELKRESDYLFCISNYFDMENNEQFFKYFEHVCMNYIGEGDTDLRFYHILSLALLRLFEGSSDGKRYGHTREYLMELFEKKLLCSIDKIDDLEFRRAILNNYCYAISLLVDYEEDKEKYRDNVNEAKETMEKMRKETSEKEWLYHMEDTMGCIYFILAKYLEKDNRIYARKAKECFGNSERFYSDSERKIREQYLVECEKILGSSA